METISQGVEEKMYWYHGELYGKKVVLPGGATQGEQTEDDLENQAKQNRQDGNSAT